MTHFVETFSALTEAPAVNGALMKSANLNVKLIHIYP